VSLDLTIPCPKPFRALEMAVYCERALQDLLDLSARPRLKIWTKQGDRDVPLGLEEDLTEKLPLLGVGLEGVSDNIQMVYYKIDGAADWIPPEERGMRAGLTASDEELAWGGATRLALGAGVALGLSRLQGTSVIDHKLSLSHQESQGSEQFLQALQVKGPFTEFQNAAEALFRRTPLQALNGQRLRILEIERDVDAMMMDLLGPLRMRQVVDGVAFQRFFNLSDEWLGLSRQDADMGEKLESILVLVREFLVDEAKKSKDPEDILRAAKEIDLRLGKLRAKP